MTEPCKPATAQNVSPPIARGCAVSGDVAAGSPAAAGPADESPSTKRLACEEQQPARSDRSKEAGATAGPRARLRLFRNVALGVIACIVCSGIWTVCASPPDLRYRATRVASAEALDWYDWMSSDRLLAERRGPPIRLQSVNTRTQQSTELTGLSRSLAAASCRSVDGLSPDGKHLTATGWIGRVRTREIIDLGGRRNPYPDVIADEVAGDEGTWSADSSMWVLIRSGEATLEFGSQSAGDHKWIHTQKAVSPTTFDHAIALGALRNGRVLVTAIEGTNETDTLDLYELDMLSKRLVKGWAVPMATRGTIQDVAFSPSSEEIAILSQDFSDSPFWSPVLARLLPGPPKARFSILVADVVRRRVRRIGSLTARLGGGGSVASPPFSLRWTPDAKRISYVLDNDIWTVPAN